MTYKKSLLLAVVLVVPLTLASLADVLTCPLHCALPGRDGAGGNHRNAVKRSRVTVRFAVLGGGENGVYSGFIFAIAQASLRSQLSVDPIRRPPPFVTLVVPKGIFCTRNLRYLHVASLADVLASLPLIRVPSALIRGKTA
jgi:hypothetical protein